MNVRGVMQGAVLRQLLAALHACAALTARLVGRRIAARSAARNARLAARALERLPAATLRDVGLRFDQIPLVVAELETPAPTSPRSEGECLGTAVTDPARG